MPTARRTFRPWRPSPPRTRAMLQSMIARDRVRQFCLLALCCLAACRGTPTEPRVTALAAGRWTGSGACLSVTASGCDLAVGCGHGQFPGPSIRADGTFDVDGTYAIEVGPASANPPPPAHFSGSIDGSTLTLRVVPSGGSLPPATYSMQPAPSGTCPRPCV